MAGGYKVWLGSIETDGSRLVSDGADNKSKCLPLPLSPRLRPRRIVCAPPLRPKPLQIVLWVWGLDAPRSGARFPLPRSGPRFPPGFRPSLPLTHTRLPSPTLALRGARMGVDMV
jgi:hypothetical protein